MHILHLNQRNQRNEMLFQYLRDKKKKKEGCSEKGGVNIHPFYLPWIRAWTEEQHNCNHSHQSSNHYLDNSFIKPPPFREKNTQNKIKIFFYIIFYLPGAYNLHALNRLVVTFTYHSENNNDYGNNTTKLVIETCFKEKENAKHCSDMFSFFHLLPFC